MMEVLSLHYGPIFKRAFSKPTIFREFVRATTGIDVNVDKIHTEYAYPQRIGNVNVQYDIFAEDPEQRIIIEIQHVKEEDFYPRFLYYHMLGIIEQVGNYDEYDPPRTVYTIVVLTSVPRDGSVNFSVATHMMNVIDEFNQSHEIAPHRLIFMNPRKVNDKTPEAVKPWLELIADSLDKKIDEAQYKQPSLKELIAEIQLKTMSMDESTAVKNESAWQKAEARFRQEAKEEGREEGREEGKEEGRYEQQIQSAKVMVSKGVDVSIISEATGLTVEEIQALIV